LTGINISEKIMPEQVESATLDQVAPGETHHLTHMFTMPRPVTVNMTMFAGRFLGKRTTQPTLECIEQKFTAGSTDRVLAQREWPQRRIITGDRVTRLGVMHPAVNSGELQQHFEIFDFFAAQGLSRSVMVDR
jgi:hypothetical protein